EQFETIIANEVVKEQIEEIVKNVGGNVFYDGTKFEYTDGSGVKQLIDVAAIVKANETVTSLDYNSTTGVLTYQDEEGEASTVDLKAAVKAHETKTTLVDNQNGTYTYTSENGTQTIINVPQSVVEQFETIIANEVVKEQIEEIIKNVGGNVFYDGTKFEYTDGSGVKQLIDVAAIVKANETVTSLDYDSTTGVLTYQDEEGEASTVDLKAAVKANETVTSLDYNSTTGVLTYQDEEEEASTVNIKAAVKANETKTKLVDNQNGTLTYYNESEIDETGTPKANSGVTFDTTKSKGYVLTQAFPGSGAVNVEPVLGWTLAELTYSQALKDVYNPLPSAATRPLFTLYFDANDNPATTKFINTTFEVLIQMSTEGGHHILNTIKTGMTFDLYVNGVLIYDEYRLLEFVSGSLNDIYIATMYVNLSWFKMIPNTVVLRPTGNKLEIKASVKANTFRKNMGTSEGSFINGSNLQILRVLTMDQAVGIFEKQ
ncbi:hypothetical protein H4K33_15980, partial [Myroides sp. WP-1]|nr:hypothetical protein [Myroides sp. WP-1]